MPENIDKALKRLEGLEFKIVYRGGIRQIPAQKIELPTRDGVKITYEIVSNITDE